MNVFTMCELPCKLIEFKTFKQKYTIVSNTNPRSIYKTYNAIQEVYTKHIMIQSNGG